MVRMHMMNTLKMHHHLVNCRVVLKRLRDDEIQLYNTDRWKKPIHEAKKMKRQCGSQDKNVCKKGNIETYMDKNGRMEGNGSQGKMVMNKENNDPSGLCVEDVVSDSVVDEELSVPSTSSVSYADSTMAKEGGVRLKMQKAKKQDVDPFKDVDLICPCDPQETRPRRACHDVAVVEPCVSRRNRWSSIERRNLSYEELSPVTVHAMTQVEDKSESVQTYANTNAYPHEANNSNRNLLNEERVGPSSSSSTSNLHHARLSSDEAVVPTSILTERGRNSSHVSNISSSDDELYDELWPTKCSEYASNFEKSDDDDDGEPFLGFPDQTLNERVENSRIPLQTLMINPLKNCTVISKRLTNDEVQLYSTEIQNKPLPKSEKVKRLCRNQDKNVCKEGCVETYMDLNGGIEGNSVQRKIMLNEENNDLSGQAVKDTVMNEQLSIPSTSSASAVMKEGGVRRKMQKAKKPKIDECRDENLIETIDLTGQDSMPKSNNNEENVVPSSMNVSSRASDLVSVPTASSANTAVMKKGGVRRKKQKIDPFKDIDLILPYDPPVERPKRARRYVPVVKPRVPRRNWQPSIKMRYLSDDESSPRTVHAMVHVESESVESDVIINSVPHESSSNRNLLNEGHVGTCNSSSDLHHAHLSSDDAAIASTNRLTEGERNSSPLLDISFSDDELDEELWPTKCTESALNCWNLDYEDDDDGEPFLGFPDSTLNETAEDSRMPLQTFNNHLHLKNCTVVLKRLSDDEIQLYNTDRLTGLGRRSYPMVTISCSNDVDTWPNSTSVCSYSDDDEEPFLGFPDQTHDETMKDSTLESNDNDENIDS